MGKKLPVEKLKASKSKPVPVKIVSDSPKPSYVDEDKKWKARRDLETLQEAKAIESDKARLQAARGVAKEQMNNLKKIC